MKPRVTVVGDDLTGTVEAAAVFLSERYGMGPEIGIGLGPDSEPGPRTMIWAVDTDTRQRSDAEAGVRAGEAIRRAAGSLLVGKLDSQLRGRLVPQLAALEPDRFPLVFAPALPVQGRIVVDGVATSLGSGRVIGGAPLADLIAPLPSAVLPELPVPELAARIAQSTRLGRIAICDATDDAALDRVVAASLVLPGIRYAGSAGLVAALARRYRTRAEPVDVPSQDAGWPSTGSAIGFDASLLADAPTGAVLFVVGTAAPEADGQLAALIEAAPSTRRWTRPPGPSGWPAETVAEIRTQLAAGAPAVLRLPEVREPRTTHDADDAGLVAELAALTEQVVAGTEVPLVLTGGHTARAVLDRLGVTALDLCAEIHHGAVELRTGGFAGQPRRTVVTRPGSFGGPDSLVRILTHLSTHSSQEPGS